MYSEDDRRHREFLRKCAREKAWQEEVAYRRQALREIVFYLCTFAAAIGVALILSTIKW